MSPFCTRVVFVSFCFLLLYLIFVGTPTFSSVQIFGRSSEEPRKQTLPLCRFVTGTRHVTDDRGFVCRWQGVALALRNGMAVIVVTLQQNVVAPILSVLLAA
eukprot:TRINITY_DN322_c0_g1_i2.p1 TRINITY_DN322_c0_g1~~TRINITY_DN322_c0_g1_i2.p1  ORF type:complete len:102 (+),score=10.58 TRINITY_DN322_c0_g1_i2:65-370(+)